MIAVKATAPAIAHSSFQVASFSSDGCLQPPRRRTRIYPVALAASGGAPDEDRTC